MNQLKPFLTPSGLFFFLVATLFAQERPNVLFIAIDDLVPTIGAYGDKQAITPKMDTLASMGTTFLNHHVDWPVCGPSRATLSTSLMPEETGVMGFKPIRAILPDVITLPQHFRMNGYETAATGKFHDPRTVGEITNPNSATKDGRVTDDLLSWSIPYVKEKSYFSPKGKPAVDASDVPDDQYVDYQIMSNGTMLLDKMEQGNKPFFLAVGFKKPHLAFIAPKQYWDKYDRDSLRTAPFKGMPGKASTFVLDTLANNSELLGYEPYSKTGPPTPEQELELLHGYYACVTFVDTLIGQLLDHLSEKDDPVQPGKKMSQTTVVVVWGDHGFHLGDHSRWAKHSIMERATNAPLIIFDPRKPANGIKTMAPANTVDIYPTLCELAGLTIPEQPLSEKEKTGRPLRGLSLAGILYDSYARVHKGSLSMISRGGANGYSYRTDRYRYIEWIDKSFNIADRDLYDYRKDPYEKQNVAGNPEYENIMRDLSKSMREESNAQGSTRLISSKPY